MEKSRMISAAGALALLIGATVPAWSAGEGAPAGEDEKSYKDKEDKLIEQLSALTTTIEGLRDKPSDTVATGGGKLEGYILSSIAIEGAANQIAAETLVTDKARPRSVLIMAASDVYSADAWFIFDATVKGHCLRLVGNAACKAPAPAQPVPPRPGAAGGNPAALIGAVLPFFSSLLRSETEISSLGDGLKDSRLLAKSIVGICASGGARVAPGSTRTPCAAVTLFQPPRLRETIEKSEPWTLLAKLVDRRNEVATPKASDEVKKKVEVVDAFILSSLSADDKGRVPLMDAIRAEQLSRQTVGKDILTVGIEQAEGTILKRKGIDVALGAPSVRASGGVIVSYTLESKDPTTSEWTVTSDVFACATTLTELKRVHRLVDKDVAHCRARGK